MSVLYPALQLAVVNALTESAVAFALAEVAPKGSFLEQRHSHHLANILENIVVSTVTGTAAVYAARLIGVRVEGGLL